MKVYLAASYVRRLEIAAYSELLEQDGHTITAEWLSGVHEKPPWTEATYSQHDLQCIRDCDVFMGFTEEEDAPSIRKRGGRHVEFGYAVAYGKGLVIVGPLENSFYYLLNVQRFDNFEQARASIKQKRPTP
jgi:hypothetical protein